MSARRKPANSVHTVAEKCDCRRKRRSRKRRQSPNSATVALFCDSVDRTSAIRTGTCSWSLSWLYRFIYPREVSLSRNICTTYSSLSAVVNLADDEYDRQPYDSAIQLLSQHLAAYIFRAFHVRPGSTL